MNTLVLHYGMEGGATKVFRQLLNNSERYIAESSNVDFEDLDVWHKSETEYPSFQVFWQGMTMDTRWFRWHPVFIHNDCKPIIQTSINKIDLLRMQKGDLDLLGDWKLLLNS